MSMVENHPTVIDRPAGSERDGNASGAVVKHCRWCLEPFECTTPRQVARQMFCNRSCGHRHASRARYSADDADGYGARLANWTCEGCGSPLDPGQRVQGARPRLRCDVCLGPKLKSCPRCGESHRRRGPACSVRCSRALRERHFQRKDERRRKRVAESDEVFERFEILDRDGWMCQICGVPTDPEREHPHPLAPVVDHIIPIAAGGEHVRANVQCAHSWCNTKKGATLPDDPGR